LAWSFKKADLHLSNVQGLASNSSIGVTVSWKDSTTETEAKIYD